MDVKTQEVVSMLVKDFQDRSARENNSGVFEGAASVALALGLAKEIVAAMSMPVDYVPTIAHAIVTAKP